MTDDRACIWVLAGTNGAGKSSIAGALLRESGGDYWNPDEVARTIREKNPSLDQTDANAAAWALGVRRLDEAIANRREFFFETTLGGDTMTARLERALAAGHDVRIWYAGLESPELHIERVAERVRAGGHAISEADIRRRYDSSRRNLVRLLPMLAELKLFDNTKRADPKRGRAPKPVLVLHVKDGTILAPANLRRTPDWAKPIVAQGLKSSVIR
ncbi:MAG TPA: zeta toxin family protein [Polyangiaceae bacterium]|nr:zeta toxin family protein [Polyangiaceae bacterium]